MTGLFELLNPVFSVLDMPLSGLPAFVRIALWGVIAGAASMALYALVSPQARLKRLADETKAMQRNLRAQDGTGTAYRDELFRSLRMSMERVGSTLWPALLSSLPVLFMLGYLNVSYGLTAPVPGEPVAVIAGDGAAIEVEGGQRYAAGWTVAWPEAGQTVRVLDGEGREIYALTSETRPGTARNGGLSSLLMGAQAGTLSEGSPVDSLEIETTPRSILQPGLSAHYQWLIPFFLALVLTSLGAKFAFRIA